MSLSRFDWTPFELCARHYRRREDGKPIEYGNWQEKKLLGIEPRE